MADITGFRFGQAKNPDGSIDWANSMETQDGKINWAKMAPTVGKNFEQKTPDYAGNEGVDPALIDAYTAQRNAEQKPFTDALAKYNSGDTSVTPDQLQTLYEGVGAKSGAMATQIEQLRQEAFKNKMEAGNGFWDTIGLAVKGGALMAGGIALAGGGFGSLSGLETQAGAAAHTGMAAGEVASTGGSLVGSGGMLGTTTNALADTILNQAATGAAMSAVTGGDPLKGAIAGGIAGGFGSVLPPSITGNPLFNEAAKGAIGGAASAAMYGADILKGAVAGGAGGAAGQAAGGLVDGSIAKGAISGAANAGVSTAVMGGDVKNAILRGGVGGGITGYLSDGKTPTLTDKLISAAVTNQIVPHPSTSSPSQTKTNSTTKLMNTFGFSQFIDPVFTPAVRDLTNWAAPRVNYGGK